MLATTIEQIANQYLKSALIKCAQKGYQFKEAYIDIPDAGNSIVFGNLDDEQIREVLSCFPGIDNEPHEMENFAYHYCDTLIFLPDVLPTESI